MTITALPTPPSRSDDPGTFAAKSDALLGALPAFVTETNATAADVVTKHGEVIAAKDAILATNPETNAGIAVAAAGAAANSAGVAAASETVTITKAGEAAASAIAAAAAASSVDMPTIAGNALKVLRVNAGATAMEWGAPDQYENYITTSGSVVSQTSLVNTTAGAITLTLPASPATGESYEFTDAAGTFLTNPLTLDRNGKTVMGSATNLICDVRGINFTLWYNGSDWRLI